MREAHHSPATRPLCRTSFFLSATSWVNTVALPHHLSFSCQSAVFLYVAPVRFYKTLQLLESRTFPVDELCSRK